MENQLSLSEVLSIAERIERDGARFYRRAAGQVTDAGLSSLLVNLAQWESRHVDVFRAMRQRLSDDRPQVVTSRPEPLDPRNSAVMAALAVFDVQGDLPEELNAHSTRTDVLRLALGAERDSVVYYLGLKDVLAADEDKKAVDEIIAEEKKHIRILMQSLEQAR